MDEMKLFKRGEIYYVQLRRGKKISLKTSDDNLAKKVFTRMEREYLQGRLIKLEKETLHLFEDFEKEYKESRKGIVQPCTIRADRLALQKFKDFFGNRPMVGITEKKLQQFRSFLVAQGLAKTSVNVHIRHFKTAIKQAIRWKYINENPLAEFKTLKVDYGKPISMDEDQVKILFDKSQEYEYMKTAIPVMICTGLSRSDVCKTIVITDTAIQYRRKKTGKLVEIPIIDKLRPYIEGISGIVRLVPWKHPDTVGHKFLEVVRAAGLKGITTHKVRHTFATLMLKAGVEIATVSELLGHADISITKRFYGHIVDELKKDAMNKFNAILK